MFEALARIAGTGEILFIPRALGYDIPFTTALCIDTASSPALNVLFFVPFDLGVREGGSVRELYWIEVGLLWGHVLTASLAGPPVASEA